MTQSVYLLPMACPSPASPYSALPRWDNWAKAKVGVSSIDLDISERQDTEHVPLGEFASICDILQLVRVQCDAG